MNLAAMAPPVPSLKPKSDTALDNDKTVAVAGFANRQPLNAAEVSPKVSFGSIRGPVAGSGSIYAASDATLAQSESLRLAQGRILELEKEVEKYRYENDELASAGDIIRERAENLNSRISALEVEKREEIEILRSEMMILKGNSQFKDTELAKSRAKIEELEGRLKSDFKKIRVRERELENRLELVKAEKSALLRAKDENILDLKRKIDHLQSELDNYRVKVLELNKTIDVNQEQFKRTVRALRLALSNLEVKEESIVPLKKAE
jgi:chromosome segregation ATPase